VSFSLVCLPLLRFGFAFFRFVPLDFACLQLSEFCELRLRFLDNRLERRREIRLENRALRGCASRPTPIVIVFVMGFCRSDFFGLPDKLLGSCY
jgi:hypothetical protein